ncbi:ATPase [Altererythrobacter sp. MF3-039]|uniref:ATPase n=1 Tax=Altererythrobacter sp. MF3-039 TaxID=3252901 RepID=UPI00390CB446
MTNGSHIRAVGEETLSQANPEAETQALDALELNTPVEEDEWLEWEEDGPSPRNWTDWLLPLFYTLAIAAWTGFFGWVNLAAILGGATPAEWVDLVTQWAIPVLLIVAVWLLTMRLSRKEAGRFGDAANALSAEARALEERLTVVNRELSLAREFLGEQSRELDFLGRTATDRISKHAGELQSLIQNNGDQVDAIASVSSTALENMGKLRDDLPVIASSARDVSNRIGGAGREAQGQLDELVSGFERLNEFGQASENQVVSFRGRVDEAIAAFEAQASELDTIAEARFATLREKSEEFRVELAGREVDALSAMRHRSSKLMDELEQARHTLLDEEEQALAAMRTRISSLRDESTAISRAVREGEMSAGEAYSNQITGLQQRLVETVEEIQRLDHMALENAQAKLHGLRKEAEDVDAKLVERNQRFLAEMSKRREIFARDETNAIEALSQRLVTLDTEIATRREAQLDQSQQLADSSEAIANRIESLGSVLETLMLRSDEVEGRLGGNVGELRQKLSESETAISEASSALAELTEASVRLLELIHAGSQHSKGELSEAIGLAETQLKDVEQRGEALGLMLEGAADRGKALSDYVIRAKSVSEQTMEEIGSLHSGLEERNRAHMMGLGKLQEQLVMLERQSETLSQRSRGELTEAIAELENAAQNVSNTLAETSRASVAKLALVVGSESAKAIDKALSEKTRDSIEELEQSAARASSVSRDAAVQLRDQLGKVDELAGNLEARVVRARQQAEEQVSNDFARRMALITESLNSNAIDIAKALSSDVSDTAWTSYLRGDRGIFTRRAVQLVDNIEARDIAEIYDNDPEFRDQVSHYVADFEAMLRSVLSTRDGNTLGVTLLGSDMGKLYVVLAQAIERLRAS